jgi:pyridoxine 4-dehydrogenase
LFYFIMPWLSLIMAPPSAGVANRNVKRTMENQAGGDVVLSAEDLAEIAQLLDKYPRKGARYFDSASEKQLHLWG